MRTNKVFFTSLLVTTMALTYVHQRVEIFKEGYRLQEHKRSLSQLVDQNSKLMYNLSKMESPRSLLTTLSSEQIEFAGEREVRPSDSFKVYADSRSLAKRTENFIGHILDVFTVKAEASSR